MIELKTYGTETTDGYIEYYKYRGVSCPVVLDTAWKKNSHGNLEMQVRTSPYMNYTRAYPARTQDGRLIFALPGGGRIAEGDK